jgi:hypothetical protein
LIMVGDGVLRWLIASPKRTDARLSQSKAG